MFVGDEDDADFIVAAREAVPELIAEIERLRAEVFRLEEYEYDAMREKGVWPHCTPEEHAAWVTRYDELESRIRSREKAGQP